MSSRTPGGEPRLALGAGVLCYLIWGFVPLAFQAMGRLGIAPWEILAHRALWGVPAALALVLIARQGRQVLRVLTDLRLMIWLTLSAALIAANWAIYVAAVNSGHVLEGSFGYYITPLINMASGALFFRERMDRIGLVAIALAGVGVVFQGLALGHLPWVSLALALSFGGYGMVRKLAAVDAQAGLLIECLVLAVPSLAYLVWLGDQGHFFVSTPAALWLIAAGPLTAIPLALFAWTARRVPMITLGFLQFLGSTIGFGIGIAQRETFTTLHAVSFAFIWTGAMVFVWGAWLRSRRIAPV
jgi:chloramphenicol-sensitive protein RarD